MKNFKIYTLVILAAALIFQSCDDEGFITKTNPNQPSTESFYSNPDEAELAVVSAYSALQFFGVYNRYWNYSLSARAQESDFTSKQSGLKEVDGLDNFTVTATNQAVEETWRDNYMGIWKSNMVLDNVPDIAFDDEAQKNRILGEASLLRALYHFNLVRNFGDNIPYYLSSPSGDELYKAGAEAGEIYEKVIFPSLKQAQAWLPNVDTYRGTNDIGRATKGAATAFLAEAYMALGEYQLAADELSKIVDGSCGTYKLVERFRDNHDNNNENNEESIFEVQYQLTLGEVWNIVFENENASEAQIIEQGQTMIDGTGGMWWNMEPSDWAKAEFETSDPRYYKTIWCPGGDKYLDSDGVEKTYEEYIGARDGHLGWRKWGRDYATGSWESDVNVRVMRLADVYLMYAECLVEGATGNAGGTAAEYINKVRDRARNIPDAGNYALTGTLPTVEDLIASAPRINGVVINNMRAAVRHERNVELMDEGKRWHDIVRWGIADDVLPSNYKLVLPIPQKDLDANDNLNPNEAN